MELTRRDFGKRIGWMGAGLTYLVVFGNSLLVATLTGCGLINDLENWIPVAKAAMNSIANVLAANGFPLGGTVLVVFNDVIAALDLVLSSAQTYNSTTPPPVGALAALQAAINAVTANLGKFLQSLNIPGGGLLSAIIGVAQVVISTIMAFAHQLPPTPSGTVMAIHPVWQVGTTSFAVEPKSRSRRAFKKDFNAVLDKGAKAGVNVPVGAKLPISLMEHF